MAVSFKKLGNRTRIGSLLGHVRPTLAHHGPQSLVNRVHSLGSHPSRHHSPQLLLVWRSFEIERNADGVGEDVPHQNAVRIDVDLVRVVA